MSCSTCFPEALRHGDFQLVFPNIYFLVGEMKTVLMGANWQFSRNMTVVRDPSDNSLTILNSVRLDDNGLGKLDALGQVKRIVRLGSLHGRDDAFYKSRYQSADYWAAQGMPEEGGLKADHFLTAESKPMANCEVFLFEKTKLPEAIIKLNQEGGILIACDALQNWLKSDEFFSEESKTMMTGMGFFTPANLGPVWCKVNEPQKDDFERLKEVEFRHVLPGHGDPCTENAREQFHQRFNQVFGI
jgi:hypothetical protein